MDEIPAKFLKASANEIVSPLTNLVNLSLTTGSFATQWKKARICSIFKAGDNTIWGTLIPAAHKGFFFFVDHLHNLICRKTTRYLLINVFYIFIELSVSSTNVTGGDWLLANVETRGYYLVNYDLSNWRLLTEALTTNHSVSSCN